MCVCACVRAKPVSDLCVHRNTCVQDSYADVRVSPHILPDTDLCLRRKLSPTGSEQKQQSLACQLGKLQPHTQVRHMQEKPQGQVSTGHRGMATFCTRHSTSPRDTQAFRCGIPQGFHTPAAQLSLRARTHSTLQQHLGQLYSAPRWPAGPHAASRPSRYLHGSGTAQTAFWSEELEEVGKQEVSTQPQTHSSPV